MVNVSANDDLSGELVTLSVSQNSVSVYTSKKIDNAKLVLASYDSEKLIDLKILTFSLWAGSSANLPIPEDFIMVDNGKIKAMVWESFNAIMPLALVTETNINVPVPVQGINYGYLAAASVNTDSGRVKFRMASGSGAAQLYTGAQEIKIDGVTYSSPVEIVDILRNVVSNYSFQFENNLPLYDSGSFINVDGYGNSVSQLIKFTKDMNGEVDSIDTVETGGELNVFDKNSSSFWRFTSSTLQFSRNDEFGQLQQLKIDSNTLFYIVPPDGRYLYDDYAVKKYSSTLLRSGSSYQIEAYDVDPAKMNTAKAIVLYGGNPEAFVTADTPAAVVTGISKEAVDNENLTKLTVYFAGIGVSSYEHEQSVYAENDATVAEVQIGDVIRYGTTPNGYIKDGTIQKLVSVSDTDIEPFTTDQNNTLLSSPLYTIGTGRLISGAYDYRVVHGLLYDATDDLVRIAPTGTRTKEAIDVAASTDLQTLPLGSATKYYIYDQNCNQYDPVSERGGMMSQYIGYLSAGEGSDESAQAAQEVFAFEQDGIVRMVYIINR